MNQNTVKVNNEGDGEFVISNETFGLSTATDLGTAITDSKKAIDLFCDNQFHLASELFKPFIRKSMYHALGNASYLFLDAILSYDQVIIQKAMEEIDNTLRFCDSLRRKRSYMNVIKKLMNISVSNRYSSEEIHAELIHAELLSLKSILTFLDGKSNNFAGFITAGLKLRNAFNSFKECETLLNLMQENGQNHDIHFETGVRIGIGSFNILLSHLPAKITRLLEFVGFSGNRTVGICEVMKCYNLGDGLRHFGSVMALLIYNLIMMYFVGNSDGNLELCDDILNIQLNNHPESAVFLYFKGRLEFLRGNIQESNDWHMKSWKSQSVWPHLHYFSFWEIMWNLILMQDWKTAETYADYLVKQCRWSRTIFCYQKASIMLMRYSELTEEERTEVEVLMNNLPNCKQRIAGKSVPMEKFCIKKLQRYKHQNNYLVLPVYELLFLWNLFKPLCKNKELCDPIYKAVVDERNLIAGTSAFKSSYDVDNQALLLFLEGLCLVQMNDFTKAERVLKSVVALEENFKDDFYIVPYSYIELANMCIAKGNIADGVKLLQDTKTKFSGYSLENRVHFQIHSALEELKNKNMI